MDSRNINREKRKRQLRSSIVNSQEASSSGRIPLPRRRKALLAIFAVLIIAALAGFLYLDNKHYTGYSVVWEKELEQGNPGTESFKGYQSFGGGVISYSKDGASYTDSSGKIIWERSYEMSNPIISVCGDYAAIADRGSHNIYIFNKEVNTGAAEAVLPITKISVSGQGIVYAVLRDSEADYITAFNNDGSAVVLSIKSVLTGDGYPFDIAVSPDGTQLISSYYKVEGSNTVSSVIFRNFGDVGQSTDARKVVGGFSEEFKGHIAGRVNFSDNTYSQAVYDGGIVFFSTKVLTSPEIIKNVSFEEEINSIAFSGDYVGVILNQQSAEAPYRLEIYKKNGARLSTVELDFRYDSFDISGNYVFLYTANSCKVFTVGGKEKLSTDFDLQVSKMIKGKLPGEIMLVGNNVMQKIKMR